MNILFDNLESLIDAPNGIEKARELILQLAIQGKIVKQDSNDEESDSLVKRIKGKNVKQISDHPEIIRLVLPQGWSWQIIDNIVLDNKHSIKRGPFGSSIKKDFFVPKGIKVYEQKHAIKNNFEIGSYFIDEEKYQELKAFEVKPNDIIISCSGTIGKVAIVPEGAAKGIINQALLKLSLNTDLLMNEYFLMLFPAYFMKTETLDNLQGTAIKNIVSVKELKSLPFPLPSFNEQKRIVEKVDSLMSLLDELEEKRERRNQKRIKLNNASLEKLLTSKDDKELKTNWKRIEENFSTLYSVSENVDKLKQAILQLAVQGKLVTQDPKDEPASELLKKIKKEKEKLIVEGKIKRQNDVEPLIDEEKPFELPKGWEWVRLGSIINIKSSKRIYVSDYRKTGVPFYRSMEIGLLGEGKQISVELFISEEKYKEVKEKNGIPKSGDILLACIGGSIGNTWVVDDRTFYYKDGNLVLLEMITEIDTNYLLNFLNSELFYSSAMDRVAGSAYNALTIIKIDHSFFPLPPFNEQKRIVGKVNELMGLCNALEEKLTKKEATAEKLVGAVVNKVTTEDKKKIKREQMIKDIIKKHPKALEKLR